MGLPETSIRRPILATMMNVSLIVFGLIGLARLPVRELPDVDPPLVNITTVYAGANAAVMEIQVTEPIEEALMSIEGIKTLTSESRDQVSNITVEFDLGRSIDLAAQDVRDRVSRVRGRLPEEVDEPIVAKQDADAQPVMWVALYSDRYSTLELTTIGEQQLKDRLQAVKGVSSVLLGGAKRFAIRLWLDPAKMAARGITVLDVQQALREQSVELPSGRVENWQRELSIETRGELKTPEEYDQLVLKRDGATLVRLRDVGHAAIGVEDERSVARYNSRPAVGLGIVRQSKSNTIEVAKGIKAELARIKPLLPPGIEVHIPYDESIFVERSIKEVWENLWMSFLLVIVTIYIFLSDFRSTLVPAVAIPVSVIATFGCLYLLGYSINIVTMLALVLAIGEVVDDAIVVVENVYRHVEEGMSPWDAALSGMKEITFAIISTTAALVAVFLPMAFQTSVTGRIFVELAVAVSCSVAISAFVALTLSPMMAARVLRSIPAGRRRGGLIGFFERRMEAMHRRYDRALAWSLRHRAAMVALIFVSFGLSLFFYAQLEKEFLPTEDKGRLFNIVITPEGSTSEYTDRMVRKMEGIIQEQPEVDGFFSAVALPWSGPGRANQGLAFVRLKDARARSVQDMVAGPQGLGSRFFTEIEGAIAIPIVPKAIGRGFGQTFQLVLQHQNLKELAAYAQTLTGKLQASGYLLNARPSFQFDKPQLALSIDRNRAAALGVSVEDISRTLQILFGGLDLSTLNLEGKEYDVIVQLLREARLTPRQLDDIYVRSSSGQLIQLSNIVTYQETGGPSTINHHNRFRSATIEATPMGVALGTAMERTEALLQQDLPPGFRYEWAGEAKDLQTAGQDTVFVLLLALAVIYMVLASQFESLIHPFTVMLTLPLAALGALGLLWLLAQVNVLGTMMYGWAHYAPNPPAIAGILSMLVPRIPAMGINLYSQIGMILLLGIVTKNGILLVDFANQQVAEGKKPLEAMLIAGRVRLRPILMTAVATVAGTLPVAFGFGEGAESRRPLGVATLGGMALSTFLTLFVIPVVYVLLSDVQERLRRHRHGPPTHGSGNGAKSWWQQIKSGTATELYRKLLLNSVAVPIVVSIVLIISGCAVGPDYRHPETAAPLAWKVTVDAQHWQPASPADARPLSAWWDVFNDPALDALQRQALEANQELAQAIARVEQARATARVTRSALVPSLELNPSYDHFQRSSSGFGGSGNFRGDIYSVPLDLSYEIDLWGKVRRTFEAARAETEASLAAQRFVLLTVTTDVARHYFTLRQLEREIEILLQTVELRRAARQLADERAAGGVVSELDVARAKTEFSTAEAELADVRRRRAEVENALAVLCGQAASTFTVAVEPLEGLPPAIPPGLPSTLLERRMDVAEAERRLAAANAQIGVAQAAFFPVLSLTGSAGFVSDKPDDVFERASKVWALGPSLSVPITAVGRNRANLAVVKAAYDEALGAYRQRVLVAFADVESALANLQWLGEQAQAQAHVVDAAREAAQLSDSRYQQGLVNYLEAVDAERQRLQAERTAVQILSNRLASTVLLIKALGGEWQVVPATPAE